MTKQEGWSSNQLTRPHLTNDALVRAMNDELPPREMAQAESHLSGCDECGQRYRQFQNIFERVEALAADGRPAPAPEQRELLLQELALRQSQFVRPPASKVLRRFSWGMAAAATLALGILFTPHRGGTLTVVPAVLTERPSVDTLDVNGETFAALPYSNPDLPVSTAHIVQMQVPVSSLTDAGVAFEPVSTREGALDHSVLADVLVGMDGQPLGIHILSAE